VVTDLAEADYQEYYNGFANRVLWPILHYRLDLAEYSRRDLSSYRRVNAHFAAQLHDLLRPDDIIWVHDYHLIPLAKMLRDRGHENRIGFFLHVPCPPPDILTALPNHEWLIPQLSAYDLVGFQTENDAANFARYLENECRLHKRNGNTFQTAGRTMRIGVFPIGIETAEQTWDGSSKGRALAGAFVLTAGRRTQQDAGPRKHKPRGCMSARERQMENVGIQFLSVRQT
jgi:trehalose 6-phosphate synthase